MAGWYTVKQGDCLASLAVRHGLPDWRAIYNHPQNGPLQQKRPNPNVIAPGDRAYIPDRESQSKDAVVDQRNTYKLARDKTTLRVVVADEDGQPYQQVEYQLTIGEETFTGRTDGEGMVRQVIDAQATSGVLKVMWPDAPLRQCTWQLKLGHLDPASEISGVQARLNNLGYPAGPVDGILGPVTRAAVRAFQDKYQLTVDGDPGPNTQAKLEEVHGS